MERHREHHRDEERDWRQSLGVWLCDRYEPAVVVEGQFEALQFLRREFHRWSRDVRRTRRPSQFRPARDFTLPGACGGVESAVRLDDPNLTWIWLERQQP